MSRRQSHLIDRENSVVLTPLDDLGVKTVDHLLEHLRQGPEARNSGLMFEQIQIEHVKVAVGLWVDEYRLDEGRDRLLAPTGLCHSSTDTLGRPLQCPPHRGQKQVVLRPKVIEQQSL